MVNILICGIGGKMGKVVYEIINKTSNAKAVCGVDAFYTGNTIECPVYSNFENIKEKVDVIVDFSRPEALTQILNFAKKNKCNIVLATTGYTPQNLKEIDDAAKEIAIFRSANFSLGVNLLAKLCEIATSVLNNDYDIEIIEKHHNQKIDAPSGTALMLADRINKVLDNKMSYTLGRSGKNCKRTNNEIGVHSIRGGTIVGDHEVLFTANDETITLSHSAQSKQIFANGAVKAAMFLCKKPSGQYSMNDIFNF